MPLIRVKDLTIEFPIYGAEKSLRKIVLKRSVGGFLGLDSRQRVSVTALKNISFECQSGDSIGFIGHNGAGKTTLLQAIAGVYEPVSGKIEVQGNVSTFFNISLGMDLDDTGFRNIMTCGLVMGMSLAEIKEKTPDIVAFSELGDFINLPVRTYSAGMSTRLAFAIATSIKPDILLLDEIIGAGDASFQMQARKRIDKVMSKAKILVLASHSKKTILEYCNKAILLHAGEMRAYGSVEEVMGIYEEIMAQESAA